MYALLVGGGNIGENLAKMLIAEKNDIALVELDEKRASELADKLDALIIKGDGTNVEILKDAGLDKADVMLALTKEDKVNLMVCEIAKSHKVKKVMARVNNPANETLFVQAGVDAAISTSAAVITTFRNILSKKESKALMTLAGGKLELFEIHIKKGSPALEKKIENIELPKGATAVGIERKEEVMLMDSDVGLKEGDVLIVMAKAEVADKVLKALTGE